MGVTALWTVVQPCARPIKLETLNKKRLAVDASIWIYQFLKAVRDKEGNALRNSHVVGFFRRICKLLYFGIKPVFVFDGGAPTLKRQTIAGRKSRREGRREDAVRTAGKLLAVQMHRRAEEEERKRKEDKRRVEEEEEVPDELVYVEELGMSTKERQQSRSFKKKDQYHLPELDVAMSEMGAPNDPRVMSQEELEDYARQFHSGEDVNLYDFSKIDFNSPFFLSLPPGDRYNILNAARLRSRLRMGYSKEQLDGMFPNRMEFSRFQIERVRERNELTQRLMHITGMVGQDGTLPGVDMGGRIAGEKGREYVLVKNDGVEGGWALGVVGNKNEGKSDQPIDVEGYGQKPKVEEQDEDEWEDEDGFEDVPIEGLNRLPKTLKRSVHNMDFDYDDSYRSQEIAEKRRAVYKARKETARRGADAPQSKSTRDTVDENIESLFVTSDDPTERMDTTLDALFQDEDLNSRDDDDDLRRAIEMSLENPEDEVDSNVQQSDKPLKFNKESATTGQGFAHEMNSRARRPNIQQTIFEADEDEDADDFDDGFDLQAALAESRSSKHQPTKQPERQASPQEQAKSDNPFSGPLPFESLSLGKSIFSKKKKKHEEEAGGFERDQDLPPKKKDSPKPLPPWFAGETSRENPFSAARTDPDNGGLGEKHDERFNQRILNRTDTGEVINIDSQPTQEVIDVDALDVKKNEREVVVIDDEVVMDDVAELTRAEPPISKEERTFIPRDEAPAPLHPESSESEPEEVYEWEESDREEAPMEAVGEVQLHADAAEHSPDWSQSQEFEDIHLARSPTAEPAVEASPSPDFEDVPMAAPSPTDPSPIIPSPQAPVIEESTFDEDFHPSLAPANGLPVEESYDYSDPEDEDLMLQLAIEAEEHARFAASLNHQSETVDYDKELRQLRNQQKKDRRDADEVTHIMINECQQLLKHFGLPYITAPMEAEAQCAELVHLGLVDGIVTDDSDIFLFGGTRVYKNLFNQAKFVECYLSGDLEKEYALDRQKLIRFAHLLGSDYTEGIPSVGPVTALEILTEFSTLEDFRDWWTQVQMGAKLPEDAHSTFRKKFKRNAAKLFLPPVFPDTRVDEAYLHPEVDSDPSAFQWGVPNLDSLRSFLMTTIGWTPERTDEVLVPVIRDMNRRENEGTQSNITNFFGGGVGAGSFAPRVREKGASGRMEKAFGRLREQALQKSGRGTVEVGDVPEDVEAAASIAIGLDTSVPKNKGKKRRNHGKIKKKSTERERHAAATAEDGTSDTSESPPAQDGGDDDNDNDDDTDDETYSAVKHTSKRRRKAH